MSGQKSKSNGSHRSNGNTSPKARSRSPSGCSDDVIGIAPIPPDGGWGWVVTFSSFMVGLIVDGICFTFGFFFLEFQTYFGSNKSVTSLINSTLNGTYLTIGPIVGALVNKYGCRRVAMIGAVISSVSFFVCTYSPNITIMILLYGFCGGIGFGLMYLPAIVMVGYYFDKRRALATGIAVCGSGIGSFVFAPLCEFLLSQYSWKGAMWIISALSLHGLVFATLYRPLLYDETTGIDINNGAAEAEDIEDPKSHWLLTPSDDKLKRLFPKNQIYKCKSLEHCNGNKTEEVAKLGHSLFLDTEPHSRKHAKNRHVLNPLERKDIFYSGSLQHLPEYKTAGDEEMYVRSMLSINEDNESEDSTEDHENVCMRIFKDMFDFSLLKSITFDIYCLSCLLCMIGFFVPFIYIPDIAREYGMSSSQSAWIISTVGIVNTIGRLAVGWMSDKPWADAIFINTVALVVAGATTMFVPFYKVFPIHIAYAIIFGFSIAAFVSLRSIIIVELLGIDKLTNSFGVVVLCQGLSTFIGAPIAGALFDATGDYRASFYLAGTVIVLSGVICLPLRRISRWEKRRLKESMAEEGRPRDDETRLPMMNNNGTTHS